MTVPKLKTPSTYLFYIFYLTIISSFTHNTFAQSSEKKFHVNFNYETPVTGILAIDDDPLFGLDIKYFLLHKKPHHVFLSASFLTDEDKTGGATEILNFNIGSQHDLGKLWGKNTYLEYAIGATYISEEYNFQLIDRDVKQSFSESGFKASIAYGLRFSPSIGAHLSLNQYSNDSTNIGLNLFYAF